ncbi:MAG TPA: protein kinase [Myxococcaceae bacterium]
MKLAAVSEDELRQELKSVSANGLFVPADPPRPLGSRVSLRLAMSDGQQGALAEAVISRHIEHEGTKGMLLRITRWDQRPDAQPALGATPSGDGTEQPRIAATTNGGFRLPPAVAERVKTGSMRAAAATAGSGGAALATAAVAATAPATALDLAKTLDPGPLLAELEPRPTPARERTPPPRTPVPRTALSGERRAVMTSRPSGTSHEALSSPGHLPEDVGENEPTPEERMPAAVAKAEAPPISGPGTVTSQKEPKTGGSAGGTPISKEKSGESRPGTPSGKTKAAAQTGLRSFDVLGSYQVLKRLGGGGMADVHLARAELSEGVDKLVALKTVLSQFGPSTPYGSMFLHEARISATLQHPNLVQVFAFGEAQGHPYLAMEYIHGRDLAGVIKAHKQARKPISATFALAVVIELCKALSYVHEKKDLDGRPLELVHRDVSPANVVLSERSEVKLMDFGVAAANAEGALGQGLMIGKAEYMPLEQATGGKPSPAWDLFSAGVVLYELLTLRRPYPKVTADQFVQTRRNFDRIPPRNLIPSLPESLSALAMKATHPDPSQRHASARDLQRALEDQQLELGFTDIGAEVQRLFGDKLKEEEEEIERLMAEARRRAAARRMPAFLTPLVARGRAVRRRVAGSRVMVELSRRPMLRLVVLASVVLLIGGGGLLAGRAISRQRALTALVVQTDAQLKAGRLVGAGGDEALGLLLKARALSPGDERVGQRLAALADKFESLADAAMQKGNRVEAAAHLEAAVQADPSRAGAKDKLAKIEAEIRSSFKGRVLPRAP